jgi:hypothetical protein
MPAQQETSHTNSGSLIFFSSGFAIIRREFMRFFSQKAERKPAVAPFSRKSASGDITGNFGPNTDVLPAMTVNMPGALGFTIFLDSRGILVSGRVFLPSGRASGRACDARGFWIMRVFILLPQVGQYFWFHPGGMG